MDQSTPSRKKEVSAGLAVLAIVIILVLAITLTSKKKTNATLASSNQPMAQTSSQTSTSSSSTVGNYKDGSYNGTGSYESPGGQESIIVSVTLKNSVVTATSAKSGANDSEAKQYQSQFISGYKKLVVGKPISGISLSRVSGSSLTSEGFNEAIDQIKQQAQS